VDAVEGLMGCRADESDDDNDVDCHHVGCYCQSSSTTSIYSHVKKGEKSQPTTQIDASLVERRMVLFVD
jgi:hypothetical protein